MRNDCSTHPSHASCLEKSHISRIEEEVFCRYGDDQNELPNATTLSEGLGSFSAATNDILNNRIKKEESDGLQVHCHWNFNLPSETPIPLMKSPVFAGPPFEEPM